MRECSVAEASGMLMAGLLLAALLGAVRQGLFHAQFGASSEASAFYAALRLPDMLFSLLAGGALSSALIPVLLQTAQEEGQAAAARLTAQVLTSLLVGFALLVLLLEVCTPFFVRVALVPGFADATSRLTITLTRLMLVQPLILVLGAVATAVLNSRSQFLLTALALQHSIWWPTCLMQRHSRRGGSLSTRRW
jgi:putative peptidoglycan lipid II flippase